MTDETLFYVLGLGLVAIALIVSFVGCEFDKFPTSRGLLVGGTVAIAALVAGDDDLRLAQRRGRAGASRGGARRGGRGGGRRGPGPRGGGGGRAARPTTVTTSRRSRAAAAEQGAELFATAGCTGCHTLADAGSTGTTGPDLDGALADKDAAFIETVDRRSERRRREGLPARRDAADLRRPSSAPRRSTPSSPTWSRPPRAAHSPWLGHSGVSPRLNAEAPIACESRRQNIDSDASTSCRSRSS